MSHAHSRTYLALIINHFAVVFVNSLTFSSDTSTMYLPARQGSGGRATGNDNRVYYDGSGGSSRASNRNSQKIVPKYSSNPHVAASGQTKLETIVRTPLSSPNLNLSAARRAQDGLRGAARHSQKSQSLVAVAGVPYYPVAVGFRKVYTIPYPWVYYAVYPTSWRPPAIPATPVVNVPVVVHVHPQIVPVQVPTFVSNSDGGVGFALGDGSGVAGSNNPTPDDGTDAGFVPTYGCGTAKAANCRS